MSKFRKKPVEVEAMRLHAETIESDFLDPNTRAQAEIAAAPQPAKGAPDA